MTEQRKKPIALVSLLAILVVVIVGFTSWYVVSARHNTDTSYAAASTQTPAVIASKSKPVATTVAPHATTTSKRMALSLAPQDAQAGIAAVWDAKVAGWRTNADCNGPNSDKYQLTTLNDMYALGGLGCDGGAGTLFVKVNGTWTDVASSQGEFKCDVIQQYSVPKQLFVDNFGESQPTCMTGSGQSQPIS